MIAKEIWKDIEGYEGLYQVSDKGRVRREGKTLWTGYKKRRKVLTPVLSNGYPMISLCKNGVRNNIRVHRLVAKAFIPNPDGKPEINHINGNKRDNRVCNLEWCTQSENIAHAFNTGLASGKRYRKLTYEQAEEIRSSYLRGTSPTILSEKYGIDRSSIHKIIERKIYKSP